MHTMFRRGNPGRSLMEKNSSRKKHSLKKSLHFESVTDFIVWITLPSTYMFDKFCHIVADPLCSHRRPSLRNPGLDDNNLDENRR